MKVNLTRGLMFAIGVLILAPNGLYAAIQFEHGSIFTTGLRASTIATGDLDGDGDLDLAVANIMSHSITIAYNDGDGNFTEIKHVPLDEGRKHPIALTVGDLDGIPPLDLAVAFVQNLDRTSLGQPAQSGVIFFFAEPDRKYIQIYQPIGGIPSVMKVDDLDGDGDQDLLVGNNGEIDIDIMTGSILVVEAGFYHFVNKGRGLFSAGIPKLTDGALVDFQCFDFNEDGYPDIVGVNQGATDYDNNFNLKYVDMNVSVFRGSGNGLNEIDPIYVDFFPWSLDRADFNQDGRIDIAVTNVGDLSGLASFTGKNASVLIFENKGNRFSPLSTIPTPGITYSVLADDYDGDGDVDIAVTLQKIVNVGGASMLEASLRIYENDGSGNYTETGSLSIAEEPRYAVKGDFDGDGDTDIAVICTIVDTGGASNAINGEVYVLMNESKTEVSDWELF